MTNTSAAVLTMNGTDYDPLSFNISCDNNWSPTWKGTVVLPISGLATPYTLAAKNLITNPSASADLTNANAANITLQRQSPASMIGSAHGTAFKMTGSASTADSFFNIGGDAGAMRLGMQPGTAYTVSGTFYTDTPMTGAGDSFNRARRIVVYAVAPSLGSGAQILTRSDQAPNTAKTQTRLSVTFTLPNDTTQAWIRFYHGHQSTSVAYWTDLALVGDPARQEADGTPIPFFDGDTPSSTLYSYSWDGTAGSSSSTRTPAFGSVFSSPVVDPRTYPKVQLRWWFGESSAPNQILNVNLLVRTYAIDDIAGTVTLTLASDEIRLQDWKLIGDADYQPGALAIGDMLALAMHKIGDAPLDTTGLISQTVPAAATIWKVGQSADDWIRGPLRSQGLEMYYDPIAQTFRLWLTSNPGKSQQSSTTNLLYGTHILESGFGIDVDNEDYGDAAVVTYSWIDSAGASQRKTYFSAPTGGGYRKTKVVSIDTPDPGFNAANGARVIAARQGWTTRLTSLPVAGKSSSASPWEQVRLGAQVFYKRSDGSIWYATARSLEWSYPQDRMSFGVEGVAPYTTIASAYTYPIG